MRHRINKKSVVGGAVIGVVLGLALTAAAYWTQGGGGAGSASTGTTTAVVVVQDTVPAGTLYPGMSAYTLTGTFNNSNPSAVKVGTVTGALDTANLPSGCVAADFTVAGSAPVDAQIAHGDGVGSWSGVTITMNNTAVNQDACKSQSIPITYTVTAGS
ncbi:MAG TPA: hypothetical protein VGJ03_05595 [Acidimicrobiales bacterium]|jgi:hypothetical protein